MDSNSKIGFTPGSRYWFRLPPPRAYWIGVKTSDGRLLRLIALFKLVKAALLIAVGVGALKLLHSNVAGAVEHWVELIRFDPSNHYVHITLEKASNLRPTQEAYANAGESRWFPPFGIAAGSTSRAAMGNPRFSSSTPARVPVVDRYWLPWVPGWAAAAPSNGS
jgi:hypothetical protein